MQAIFLIPKYTELTKETFPFRLNENASINSPLVYRHVSLQHKSLYL